MALTATQRADVRLTLGWPAQFHQTNSRLEQAMNALDTEPEHEAQVIALLASVVDIDTKLVDAHKRLKAVKVGSINLDTLRSEIAGLRMEGRRFVARLASILGVPTQNDYFGSSARGYADRYDWTERNYF